MLQLPIYKRKATPRNLIDILMMQLVKSGIWAALWDKQLCRAEKEWKGVFRPSLFLSATIKMETRVVKPTAVASWEPDPASTRNLVCVTSEEQS